MAKIYLIRHGETVWNSQGKLQGQTDVPLNDSGKKQARRLKRYLEPENIAFIVSSSLKRAADTADIASGGRIPVYLEDAFKARRLGKFEGSYVREIKKNNAEEYKLLRTDFDYVPDEKGESARKLLERAWPKFLYWAQKAHRQNAAVIAHAITIRVILHKIMGFDYSESPPVPMGNSSIHIVQSLENGQFKWLETKTLADHEIEGYE